MKFSKFHAERLAEKLSESDWGPGKLPNEMTDDELQAQYKSSAKRKGPGAGNWLKSINAEMKKRGLKPLKEEVELEEATMTMNLDNYSGKNVKVEIDEKKGTFKTSNRLDGKFKYTDGGKSADVFVDGVEFFAYKDGKEWTCSDMGITREGRHPVEAALKVASNIM